MMIEAISQSIYGIKPSIQSNRKQLSFGKKGDTADIIIDRLIPLSDHQNLLSTPRRQRIVGKAIIVGFGGMALFGLRILLSSWF